MSDLKKYHGVIPAFYACYDEEGNISPERVRGLTRHLIGKGVNGLYVGGSSGECIYQGVEERKVVLENVMAEAKGKVVVIRPQHRLCHLQHPPTGGGGPDHLSAAGDEEKPPCDRREELLHANPGYPDVA